MGIKFSESMLSWESGPKPYDGIWGSHWYKEINNSNKFRENLTNQEIPLSDFSAKELEIIREADIYYNEISKVKITVN